jgi:hypothetical protein
MRFRSLSILILTVFVVTSSPSLNLEATGATLKPCSAKQKAQITNFSRQYYSLSDLRKLYQAKLDQAKTKLQNSTATGNAASILQAKSEIKSAQAKVDSYSSQMASVISKQNAITKTCKLESKNSIITVKKACTSSVKKTLATLASQYQSQQDLIKAKSESINQSQIKLRNAESSGNGSGAQQYRIDIATYIKDLQNLNLQASLIKQEFENYNLSCTGSGVTLPSEYFEASSDDNQESLLEPVEWNSIDLSASQLNNCKKEITGGKYIDIRLETNPPYDQWVFTNLSTCRVTTNLNMVLGCPKYGSTPENPLNVNIKKTLERGFEPKEVLKFNSLELAKRTDVRLECAVAANQFDVPLKLVEVKVISRMVGN